MKNRWFKMPVKSIIPVSIIFLMAAQNLFSQTSWSHENLTRGKLWETIWNTLQFGEPGNLSSSPYFTMDYPGYSKGTTASDALNYGEATGFSIYGKRNNIPYAYSLNTRFQPSGRYVYPVEEATRTENYNLKDPTNLAEETVSGAQHVIDLNVDVAHKSMAWSFPGYDSFVIHEITITNSSYTPITDVYFGMRYGLRITLRSGTDYDEKYKWSEEQKCFYFYDDRSFRWADEVPIVFNFGVGPERGDIGDARDINVQGSRDHELDAAGYFSAICLDSKGQPIHQNILEHLGGDFSTEAPLEDQMFRLDQLDAVGPDRLKEVMTHEQPHISWDDARALKGEGGNKWERKPEYLVSAGPYEIQPYESITLVFAEVVGEMDRAKIVEGGVANVDRLATDSRDSLLSHIKNCKEFYANNYVPAAYPPMTPTDGENSLKLEALPGSIKISWAPVPSTYSDPKTKINDFAGYKIYRSTYFTIGPWQLVAKISKDSIQTDQYGRVFYLDDNLPNGVGNYYTVTTYDLDGNESGKVNNNRFPVYPLRGSNKQFPRNVYVVPNPFRQHSGLLGTGERYRMEFIGLPAKCTIKIYTMVGTLVNEIQHDDGTGSTAWGSIEKQDYMLSKWLLGIAPGVYIYKVESHVAGQEGETFIGKFAIIK